MKKLILATAALALFIAGIVSVELVAQTGPQTDGKAASGAGRNAEREAKQQAMIDAARATYEALEALFELGTTTQDYVYVWSSRIRSSQVQAADTKQERISACEQHLHRVKELHNKVKALSEQGAMGGEVDKLYAIEFYVAEAELLLLEAKAN